MLLPVSVNVPVPVLVSPPLPEMTPAKLVEVSAAPVVSVCPAAICTLPPLAPPPASEPMVSLSVTSRVTPAVLSSTTAPVLLIAAPFCSSSVPPLTVVAPV